MTTVAGLEALRAKAGVQGKSDALDSFRTDFALVWSRERGYLNDNEYAQAKTYAGQYVREHMGDSDAMSSMARIFKSMADAIRRDETQSARIRAEARAAKEGA